MFTLSCSCDCSTTCHVDSPEPCTNSPPRSNAPNAAGGRAAHPQRGNLRLLHGRGHQRGQAKQPHHAVLAPRGSNGHPCSVQQRGLAALGRSPAVPPGGRGQAAAALTADHRAAALLPAATIDLVPRPSPNRADAAWLACLPLIGVAQQCPAGQTHLLAGCYLPCIAAPCKQLPIPGLPPTCAARHQLQAGHRLLVAPQRAQRRQQRQALCAELVALGVGVGHPQPALQGGEIGRRRAGVKGLGAWQHAQPASSDALQMRRYQSMEKAAVLGPPTCSLRGWQEGGRRINSSLKGSRRHPMGAASNLESSGPR